MKRERKYVFHALGNVVHLSRVGSGADGFLYIIAGVGVCPSAT